MRKLYSKMIETHLFDMPLAFSLFGKDKQPKHQSAPKSKTHEKETESENKCLRGFHLMGL